jgi:hypothetical protein
MPAHRISLLIPHPIEMAHSDIEIEVHSDGSKLGTLKVSQGTIDWLPTRNRVNYHEMTWERFAEMLEKEGTPRRYDTQPKDGG